jgi:tRNA A-37 threonylcarbamoyl transferase component Bud32
MNVKYTISPKYEKKYKNFVLNIKDCFNNAEKTIHKARNEIKIISYEEKQFVVKSFKKPSLIKSIYYTKNHSKAKRSYEYSIKLDDFTPEAIAYIEFYENNKLSNSFYISEYFEYDYTIKEPLRQIGFENKTKVLKEFAIFSSKLHDNGILHLDYSAGNILIKEKEDTYIFKVVDVNRMIFKTLSLNEKLKNFDMLWANNENMTIIATQYAKSNNLDIEMVVKKAIWYSFRLKLFKNFKKLLKGKIKNIDW